MKTLILFGGGDAGGILITDNGIRPIPPFSPDLLLSLKSANAVVNALEFSSSAKTKARLAKIATSLCNVTIEMAEEVVGPLDANRAIIFQDDDGGFSCGSTGKPPIPIPWPPKRITSVNQIVSSGLVETDIVALVKTAKANNMNLIEIFENPKTAAKKLDLTLSEKSINDLKVLAPSNLSKIKDSADQEVIGFFHKVLEDSRYIETWYTQPYEVAKKLKVQVSDSALERILGAGASTAFSPSQMGQGDVAVSAIGAGIAVAVVAIVVGIVFGDQLRPVQEYVTDRSGAEKF